MTSLRLKSIFRQFVRDESGQDLIEYALMAGFVAVALAAIMPGVAIRIQTIFGKVAAAWKGIPFAVSSMVADDVSLIRIFAAVLAVLFLGLIVLRNKKSAE